MPTVCFDLDGVLAEYTEWVEDSPIGAPIEVGIKLARFFKEAGWNVVIQSCRTNPDIAGEKNAQNQWTLIYNWLIANGVPFGFISRSGKALADYYIDDRGVFFDQGLAVGHPEYADHIMGVILARQYGEGDEF